jgi:hypothetical protein
MQIIKAEGQIGQQRSLIKSEYGYAKKLLEMVGIDEEPLASFTAMKVDNDWRGVGGIVLPSGVYRFIRARPKEISGNVVNGLFFGYPTCCIRYFTTVRPEHRQPDLHIPHTGYVRCPECAKLDTEELIAGINARRVEIQPFPYMNKAENVMHRWYFAATHDFSEYIKGVE